MDLYFDKTGRPMDLTQWARQTKSSEYRRVAKTDLPKGSVSTVWLGLNHSWGGGPPLIFETMVFDTGTDLDEECERYATEAEALIGHEAMVKKCRAALASQT